MIELDARNLEHPEPLERSVAIFAELEAEKIFHLIIHRYPRPLLMIAQKRGIRYEECQKSEREWHLLFTRDPTVDLKRTIEEICRV